MASTIAAAFEEGHDACVIVGADIPGIGVAHVRPALEALSQGRDMVLGPAEDGGYYLVGVAKSPDMTRDRLSRVFCPDAPAVIEAKLVWTELIDRRKHRLFCLSRRWLDRGDSQVG